MSGNTLVLVLLITTVLLTLGKHYVGRYWSGILIRRWAVQNHYRLIDWKYCQFWVGPFVLRATNLQMVYVVTIEDQAGKTRQAWVRCRSWFLGLLSDELTVEWK